MLISAHELLTEIIRPTLRGFGIESHAAEQLLLATAAQESQLCVHLRNDEADPNRGLGLYGISHQQHMDLWDNYLAYQPHLASYVRGLAKQQGFLNKPDAELITNLEYATAIAWLRYLKHGLVAPRLPQCPSVQQLAHTWQQYYHLSPNHSTNEAVNHKFLHNYMAHVNHLGYGCDDLKLSRPLCDNNQFIPLIPLKNKPPGSDPTCVA